MRIKRLMDALGNMGADAALITSRPNIFYFCGFTGSAGFLFITKTRACLYTDFRYKSQAAQQVKNCEVIVESDPYIPLTRQATEDNIGLVAVEDRDLTIFSYDKFKEALSTETVMMGNLPTKLRQEKSTEELACINEAVRLADAAFVHAVNSIREGMTEISVAAMIENFMRENGAAGPSFDTICASGARGALPHGIATSKPLEKGDLVVLDYGCILDGYCSDITRTVSVGPAGAREQEIYNIVLYAQQRAQNSIVPGMKASELDQVARDIIKNFGYDEHFGHSLGHGVGIEVHENPSVSQRSEDILSPGSVITVEPGIYIEGFGGVRIEDMVYIDVKGHLILTKSTKELIEII